MVSIDRRRTEALARFWLASSIAMSLNNSAQAQALLFKFQEVKYLTRNIRILASFRVLITIDCAQIFTSIGSSRSGVNVSEVK